MKNAKMNILHFRFLIKFLVKYSFPYYRTIILLHL